MRNWKTKLALSLAVVGLAVLAARADICTTLTLGGCEAGIQVAGVGAAPGVFDDATAVWTFNDPTDLGHDDTGNGNDMTPTNSPTATGGALGYVADFDAASNQCAYSVDADDFDLGDGVSWGAAGWVTYASAATVIGKINAGLGAGEYYINFPAGTNFDCVFHDGSSTVSDRGSSSLIAGTRYFFHCRYDATANELEAGVDGTWSGSPTSSAGDGTATIAEWTVGASHETCDTGQITGSVGPVWWYRSASGGEVLTDAYTTSLYNSGKGKTCADTTETMNLVSCWEMDEDGGPYADSVGSNDLTGVNSPTRTVGLVERSDSGMALFPNSNGSNGYLRDNTADRYDRDFSTDYSVAAWHLLADTGNEFVWYQDRVTTATAYVTHNAANDYLQCCFRDASGQHCATSANGTSTTNEWHLTVCTFTGADAKVRLSLDGASFLESTALSEFFQAGDVTDFRLPYHAVSVVALDNVAYWDGKSLTQPDAEELWASGVGSFYAAVWDAVFEGPRFAWSSRPETRRIEWN